MNAKYVGYRLAQRLSVRLAPPAAFRCAEAIADTQWRWARGKRAIVQANLSRLRGGMVPWDSPLVREVFRNFGRYLVEFFTIHRVARPEVRLDGADYLEEGRRRRRGVILLTAHMGNWEVGAALIRRMGFPVTVLALPHDDPHMDRLFNAQRRRCGVNVVPVGSEGARRGLQSLRDGGLVGLLGDQVFTEDGVAVPFCGSRLLLPRGPAVLSLRSQAPIVPTFLIREGPWKFQLRFEPPIWPPPARQPTDESVLGLVQGYAAVFEGYLRRFPEQWLMFTPIANPETHEA